MDFNLGWVNDFKKIYNWLKTLPGHGFGPFDRFVNAVQNFAIPMLFKAPPTMFNRIVLTVIRGLDSQKQVTLRLRGGYG